MFHFKLLIHNIFEHTDALNSCTLKMSQSKTKLWTQKPAWAKEEPQFGTMEKAPLDVAAEIIT